MKLRAYNVVFAGLSLALSQSVIAQSLISEAQLDLTKAQLEVKQYTTGRQDIRSAKVYDIQGKMISSKTKQLEVKFANINVVANLVKSEKTASGGIAWIGNITKGVESKTLSNPQDSVILINRNGRVTGHLQIGNRAFSIRPLNSGGHMIVELDNRKALPDHPEYYYLETQEPVFEDNAKNSANVNKLSTPVIQMVVLHTPGVSQEVADVPALIDLAIAQTNTSFANSDVNARVELAYEAPVGYTLSGSMSTDLARLKSTNDRYLTNAHVLRDSVGADVVMMLVPNSNEYCGLASQIGSIASTAFAITAQNCITNNFTFAHELGHLLWARHNPEADSNNSPFSYGHGYRDPDSNFRTVMAYNCDDGCGRILNWSNPNVNHDGMVTGTAQSHDNARVLNSKSWTVAGFRQDVSSNTVCQYDSRLSFIDDNIEVEYGYEEIDWELRWEGQTIIESARHNERDTAPRSYNHGGFRYTMGPREYHNSDGSSRDFYYDFSSYQICRTPL